MEHSTEHAVEASATQDDLIIEIRPYDSEDACYYGSRAQLDAEGLVPSDITWPHRRATERWTRYGLQWSLRRARPKGMKGPMRLWVEGDYWMLWSQPIGDYRFFQELRAARSRREHEQAVRQLSVSYQVAKILLLRKCEQAYSDKAYQAFKGKIPGLIPPPRKRKSKQAEVN